MKLMEFMVHKQFASAHIDSMRGFVINDMNELMATVKPFEDGIQADDGKQYTFPLVIKAQVQTGNRGRAGGIQFAENYEEMMEKVRTMFTISIKGLPVRKIFIAEKVAVQREMYLSITMDRAEKCPVIIFSDEGGMDINEIADENPEKIIKTYIRDGQEIMPFMTQFMIDNSSLEQSKASELHSLVMKLYKLFVDSHALMVEINPLVIDGNEKLFCLDGKMEIDDNALYLFPYLQQSRDEFEENKFVLEARNWNFLYIPIETEGTISVISNGSGMLMSSIDGISQHQQKVYSVLDLGGGATADRIQEAIRIVLSESQVELLFINIFGGITRCDEIVRGIKDTWTLFDDRKLVLRLEGTNKSQGVELLKSFSPETYLAKDLEDGVRQIAKEMGA